MLTWGLLGPGKGIEWGIDAMARLRDLRPGRRSTSSPARPTRRSSRTRARPTATRWWRRSSGSGSASSVTFDGQYRDAQSLAQLVRAADVVLLPYDSTEQVTSGVLIEAVAAGKPVVATAFPHARELLADGAGIVVPHRDPAAIAAALRTVITRQDLVATMVGVAAATAPSLHWSAVADQYRVLAHQLLSDRVAA